jgi:hypothetical protein
MKINWICVKDSMPKDDSLVIVAETVLEDESIGEQVRKITICEYYDNNFHNTYMSPLKCIACNSSCEDLLIDMNITHWCEASCFVE